jgi:hypothetical protein
MRARLACCISAVAEQHRNCTAPVVIRWPLLTRMPISGGNYEGSKVLRRAGS